MNSTISIMSMFIIFLTFFYASLVELHAVPHMSSCTFSLAAAVLARFAFNILPISSRNDQNSENSLCWRFGEAEPEFCLLSGSSQSSQHVEN